jgi:hypothetical protein
MSDEVPKVLALNRICSEYNWCCAALCAYAARIHRGSKKNLQISFSLPNFAHKRSENHNTSSIGAL